MPAATRNPYRRKNPYVAVNWQWQAPPQVLQGIPFSGPPYGGLSSAAAVWAAYLAQAAIATAALPPSLPDPVPPGISDGGTGVIGSEGPPGPVYGFLNDIGGGGGFSLGAIQAKSILYQIQFLSASWYFEAWWDEAAWLWDENVNSLSNPPPYSSPVSTTNRHFLWVPPSVAHGGLPPGVNPSDVSTWFTTPVYNPLDQSTVPTPWAFPGSTFPIGLAYGIANFRYSCVPGYVPPTDGSQNGFAANDS